MFSFFKKKSEATEVIPAIKCKEVIWMSEEAKFNAIANQLVQNPNSCFIAWFDDTYEKLEEVLQKKGLATSDIFTARQVSFHDVQGQRAIFIEHYPLSSKEHSLYQKLRLQEATIYTSLDEPLITHFTGDKLLKLMKQLNAKDTEPLIHPMITSSIKNLQQKLQKQVIVENTGRSQQDWLNKNKSVIS